MFICCILLALSSTLDSLGIGITYGIRNIRILFGAKLILFICSFVVTFFALLLGNYFSSILSNSISNIIGSSLLVFIGMFLLFSCFKKNNNFDFDCSNNIDNKEALFLGLALSLDSFGIGVSCSILNNSILFLPLLVSIFQFAFLSIGIFLGKKIKKISNIPESIWSFISGLILISIGFLKYLR